MEGKERRHVIDPETVAFLESGCAVIIGTVCADGLPWASRGWGLNVVRGHPDHIRLLIDADDTVTIRLARECGPVAITGTCVPTLQSIQVKGRITEVRSGSDADRERADQYCDAFFSDIVLTDHTPRALTERWRPIDVVVAIVEPEEVYDQTP